MKTYLGIALVLVVATPVGIVLAHPGGLDANGCHTNHRTGEYHCHRGGGYVPSGGYSAPAPPSRPEPPPKPAYLKVIAIPRARVYVDDKFIGVSPTKAVQVTSETANVRLEHSILGRRDSTEVLKRGEVNTRTIRW